MTLSTRDRAEAALRSLRQTYRSFDVHQTSVALPPTEYERALRDGAVDAAVRVEDAAGRVLAVDDGEWREPRVRLDHAEHDDVGTRVRGAFADRTGVVCRVVGLRDVSLVAVRDETDVDRDPKYVLDVRFVGRYERGEPEGGAAWRDHLDERPVP